MPCDLVVCAGGQGCTPEEPGTEAAVTSKPARFGHLHTAHSPARRAHLSPMETAEDRGTMDATVQSAQQAQPGAQFSFISADNKGFGSAPVPGFGYS